MRIRMERRSAAVTERIGAETARFFPPAHGSLERWLARLAPPHAPLIAVDGLTVPRLRAADGVTDNEILEATERAVADEARGQPGRNLRVRLDVAYMVRIEGRPWSDAGEYLQSSERATIARRNDDGPDTLRWRGVEGVVRRGDEDWRRLGGWPWATFDGPLPSGGPDGWRADARAAERLAEWHASAVRVARLRLRAETRSLRRAERP